MTASHLGLTGRVKASVFRNGGPILESGWTRNLWLDQGLNQMAETPICDCFSVASKGTGTTPTSEDLTGGANTYSITNGTSTMTRAAGTRDFVAGDVGKLMKFSTTPFAEFHITAINSVSSVEVSPNASAGIVTKKIILYSVQQTALDAEVGRTSVYGAASGDNGTAEVGQTRTFTRSFLFPSEDTLTEKVDAENTYSQTTTTVTRDSGTRDFVAGDVGSTITFADSGLTALITVLLGVSSVTVTPSQTNLAQAATLTHPNSAKVEVVTGTYSRSGAVVTRASGARNFSAGDVGKVIHFATDNSEAIITVYTDATHVTCDTSGTLAAQSITLYGFTDYQEIGFSHSEERAENLNVRVLLASPVRVYRSTALESSDQLKLTYECTLTVEPDTSTAGNLAGIITDPGNLMSGNKTGNATIESFATSTVLSTGETDTTFPGLEPYYDGYMGLSLDFTALDPLSGKVRSSGTAYTAMTGAAYVDGSFSRDFTGIFGLNDAISNSWRTLMLYDPDSQASIYAFLFNSNQKKDSNHTLQVTFTKTWGRTLP